MDLIKVLKITSKLLLNNRLVNTRLRKLSKSFANDLIKDGFSVQKGTLSEGECDTLRRQIDKLITDGDYSWCDDLKSDFRIYEAETKIDLEWLEVKLADANKMAAQFHGSTHVYTDLVARVQYTEGNLGSGGGWHRDSLSPQFKTILYLSDADMINGAFELIPGSHQSGKALALGIQTSQKLSDRRFSDDFIASNFDEILTLEGMAGDQLYVNTNAIHRGRPLTGGQRYALTRYYFNNSSQRQLFLDSLQR